MFELLHGIEEAIAGFSTIRTLFFDKASLQTRGKNRLEIDLVSFAMLVSFAHLVLFQKPLLDYVLQVSDLPDIYGYIQIASLQIIQFCLLAYVLLLVSFLSVPILKTVCCLLFLANATALYFMASYGIELSRSMIGNILNTDTREASELWHPNLMVYVVVFAGLPCLLIWKVKLRIVRWQWRSAFGIGLLIVLGGWLFATSFTWLWYDKHMSRMGSRVLPWSYVVNTARHFSQKSLENRKQVLLPKAEFLQSNPTRKQIVVLVIGEAARADNFSHYGYFRDTNPFTRKAGMIALPVGLSCATNTLASTACILTHQGSKASARTAFEPLPSYLTRHGIETIFRTNNSGPPPVKVTRYERAAEIAKSCAEAKCPNSRLDEALNWRLAEALKSSNSNRIFVLLHQSGSHGPAYSTKYPVGFEHFSPVCDTVQIASCSPEELVNAYDNTIRYTDFLLAELTAEFRKIEGADVAMIYVSDHGQSLGEAGLYLHGVPNAFAPAEQRRIPFLVWMSDSFMQSRGISRTAIIPERGFPHDFAFHSVMGAFGMSSDIYKPEFDIFNTKRTAD